MGNGIPSGPLGGQGMVLTACSGGTWAKGTQGAHSHHPLQISAERSLLYSIGCGTSGSVQVEAREQIRLSGAECQHHVEEEHGKRDYRCSRVQKTQPARGCFPSFAVMGKWCYQHTVQTFDMITKFPRERCTNLGSHL